MIDTHGGNIALLAEDIEIKDIPKINYDFSVNLNPLGPPPALNKLFEKNIINWQSYPDINCAKAVITLADAHSMAAKCITVGNGATELFSLILTSFNIKSANYLSPCYSGYREVCEKTRTNCISIKNIDDINADAVFIGYPNNPTGHLLDKTKLSEVIKNNKKTLFIIDESFMDFVIDSEQKTLITNNLPLNVIIIKSLTKMFNIAGIRLGMAVASQENIIKINKYKLPWSVNAFAQAAAGVLYSDHDYIFKTKQKVRRLREALVEQLSNISDVVVSPSETNFILIKTTNTELQKRLLEQGIFIRSCENIEGLEKGFYRLAVKTEKENSILIKAIKANMR